MGRGRQGHALYVVGDGGHGVGGMASALQAHEVLDQRLLVLTDVERLQSGEVGIGIPMHEDDAPAWLLDEVLGVLEVDGRGHEIVYEAFGLAEQQFLVTAHHAYFGHGDDVAEQLLQPHGRQRVGVYDGKFQFHEASIIFIASMSIFSLGKESSNISWSQKTKSSNASRIAFITYPTPQLFPQNSTFLTHSNLLYLAYFYDDE